MVRFYACINSAVHLIAALLNGCSCSGVLLGIYIYFCLLILSHKICEEVVFLCSPGFLKMHADILYLAIFVPFIFA